MKGPFLTGVSFGLTSGIITTLGLIVGLNSGTGLKIAVIGGILAIAISDAFGDAFGMYVSEEFDKKNKYKEINESAFATFIAKLFVALSFIFILLVKLFRNIHPKSISKSITNCNS